MYDRLRAVVHQSSDRASARWSVGIELGSSGERQDGAPYIIALVRDAFEEQASAFSSLSCRDRGCHLLALEHGVGIERADKRELLGSKRHS
jgi:hypothetical protein